MGLPAQLRPFRSAAPAHDVALRAASPCCRAAHRQRPARGARAPADTFIQKTKKLYQDTRTQRNLARLNADIAEVHSIMTRNIADVLGQGERLDRELWGLRGVWRGQRPPFPFPHHPLPDDPPAPLRRSPSQA